MEQPHSPIPSDTASKRKPSPSLDQRNQPHSPIPSDTASPDTTSQTKAPSLRASDRKRPQRLALGRGLKALLSDVEVESIPTRGFSLQGMDHIPISQIDTNPYQPRLHFDAQSMSEIKQSISVHGLIQPITVRAIDQGRYQLISGERRLQACRQLGMERVPAFVRQAKEGEMLEMALIENIQRESLNAIEIALSYQRLISECHLKQDELALRVGKERSTVTNYLRLLKLPPSIQAALRDQRISMGHARSLLSVEDPSAQLLLLDQILEKQLSVRETEKRTHQLAHRSDSKASSSPPSTKTSPYRTLQEELSSLLGTKVRLHSQTAQRGEIRIAFFSPDDLNRIVDEIRS